MPLSVKGCSVFRSSIVKSRCSPDALVDRTDSTIVVSIVFPGGDYEYDLPCDVDYGLHHTVLLGLDLFGVVHANRMPESLFSELACYNGESSQLRPRTITPTPDLQVGSSNVHISSNSSSHPTLSRDFPLSKGTPLSSEHWLSSQFISSKDQYDGVEGFHYVKEILSGQRTKGVSSSLFGSCLESIQQQLSIHGILSHGLDLHECRSSLAFHIFSGDCVENRVSNGDRSACIVIRNGFSSPSDMSRHAFEILSKVSSSVRPNDDLFYILKCLNIQTKFDHKNVRLQLKNLFMKLSTSYVPVNCALPHGSILKNFERTNRVQLLAYVHAHKIRCDQYTCNRDDLKDVVIDHFVKGFCYTNSQSLGNPSCQDEVNDLSPTPSSDREFCLTWLKTHVNDLGLHPIRRVLQTLDIDVPDGATLIQCRNSLKKYLKREMSSSIVCDTELLHRWEQRSEQWPRILSDEEKRSLIHDFRTATSTDALRRRTCASCSGQTLCSEVKIVKESSVDLRCFLVPNRRPKSWESSNNSSTVVDPSWIEYGYPSTHHPKPIPYCPDVILDTHGVEYDNAADEYLLSLCPHCYTAVSRKKIPALALANHNYVGDVPLALQGLTQIEEQLISRCRSKRTIIHMKENCAPDTPATQKTFTGHTIIFPQENTDILQKLPPSLDDICGMICVVFVGSKKPTNEWIRKKATPLLVRRKKVGDALQWLRNNNPLYKHIQIDNTLMAQLPMNGPPDIHIEFVEPSDGMETLTSRYDTYSDHEQGHKTRMTNIDNATIEPPFPTVLVADVDPNPTSEDMKMAAARHFRSKKAFLEVGHAAKPANEYQDPSLFPLVYPTLFPYGIGGFEEPKRSTALSLKRQAAHLLTIRDKRFQCHHSFMFTLFNLIQRREMLLHTSLQIKRAKYNDVAAKFADISPAILHDVATRIATGNSPSFNTENERKAATLLKEVNAVAAHVPGSSASKVRMRNEIKAMIVEKGLPSFYLTINPSDLHNPIIRLLAGEQIDLENLMASTSHNSWEQSVLLAKNPTIGARFFEIYMDAFIKTLLRFDSTKKHVNEGVLGLTKSYYGCVEAQGRGSLHCHMLIWIEGALNPDEVKHRLINEKDLDFGHKLLTYLNDIIVTEIPSIDDNTDPPDPRHPCTHRGPPLEQLRQSNFKSRDVHDLAKACQVHKHTTTCFKYCGPASSGSTQACRFGLSEENTTPESSFDSETGELNLRKLDGLVNNFNDTILEAIRCNMDIKFIGSGPSVKAVIYYITDYITKSQLKAHVAYAALALAIEKLGEYSPSDSTIAQRAKRLIQRCAYSMINHQELSAQQVASYLLDIPDHFKSHDSTSFYWTTVDSYLQRLPSNELPDISLAPLRTNNDHQSQDQPTPEHGIDDDVTISVENDNMLKVKADKLTDYINRSSALDKVPFWDFIAQFEKVKKLPSKSVPECVIDDIESALKSSNERHQPMYNFLTSHPEHKSHYMVLKNHWHRRNPTALGPSLPRRDLEITREQHSRLMLGFFKPWRTVDDLKPMAVSWCDTFDVHSFSERHLRLITNMQLLHECKDSRDDHFIAQRNDRRRTQFVRHPNDDQPTDTGDLEDAESAVLDHLLDTQSTRSSHTNSNEVEAHACKYVLNKSSLWTSSNSQMDYSASDFDFNEGTYVSDETSRQHQVWRSEYVQRNAEWRNNHKPSPNDNVLDEDEPANMLTNSLRSLDSEISLSNAALRQMEVNSDPCQSVNPAIAMNLNTEQRRAFDIVAQHSRESVPSQLRMFLGGAGGTGKSQVIKALKLEFEHQKQQRRFRLASFTGIAAKNISGMTLHAALNLNLRTKNGYSAKTKKELIAFWDGVDYLFIDEVSVIGCKLLLQISEALSDIKQTDAPFGGINIIFAGDFAQLPPVGDTQLYAPLSDASVGRPNEFRKVLGKLLWYSITTVVILKEQMRQNSAQDSRFVELLTRLRTGTCNSADFELLQTRLLENIDDGELTNIWCDSSIIVSKNESRDVLNEEAAFAFAERTGQKVHWYYAKDEWASSPITNTDLQNLLHHMPSSKTNNRLGRIPMVIGMPVMLSTNSDVTSGIVNGCTGTIEDIHYYIDAQGRRHATACIINAPDTTGPALDNLPASFVVTMEDTTKIVISHPYSKKTCHIKRVQLPIVPAFAMTAHKSQGRTLSRTMIDIESCHSTESAYVMLSRVTSLSNLMIIRRFRQSKIQCHTSEALRKEFSRQNILRLSTLLSSKDEAERAAASTMLTNLNTPVKNISTDDLSLSDAATLSTRLTSLQSAIRHLPISEDVMHYTDAFGNDNSLKRPSSYTVDDVQLRKKLRIY